MIKIENVNVVGFEPAIRGMRNPMNSWIKSDTIFCDNGDYHDICGNSGPINIPEDCSIIGPNDLNLMLRLARAGSVDGKFRRMIVVYVDITAPLYWWKEFDTYKVGTVANSCSTMHKIHTKAFSYGTLHPEQCRFRGRRADPFHCHSPCLQWRRCSPQRDSLLQAARWRQADCSRWAGW